MNLEYEVPADVLHQARELFIDITGYRDDPVAQHALDGIRDGSSDKMPMLVMAQIAILAERKRCAGIARQIHVKGVARDRTTAAFQASRTAKLIEEPA